MRTELYHYYRNYRTGAFYNRTQAVFFRRAAWATYFGECVYNVNGNRSPQSFLSDHIPYP
jgi:hypothetical protein